MSSRSLDRYRVLLVGTKFPGNLGSVARLLENFSVSDAGLVAPRCDWQEGVAQWMATRSSRERLASIPLYESLAAAIADCSTVVGFTSRSGKTRKISLSLEQIPSLTGSVTGSPDGSVAGGKVALVFGREDLCLFDEEVELCTHLCALDSSPGFPALNLSHAVAVVLSRLYSEESAPKKQPSAGVAMAELEPMLRHLEEALLALGYRGEGNPARVLSKFRKIFQRAGLQRGEIALLRGLCQNILRATASEERDRSL